MRKILTSLLLLIVTTLGVTAQNYGKMTARQTPRWFIEGYTYQIQLRAFTPEGTLKAAEARLQHLKDIGVSTVYLCPVFVTDDDMDQTGWSERQKKSGYGNPKNPAPCTAAKSCANGLRCARIVSVSQTAANSVLPPGDTILNNHYL